VLALEALVRKVFGPLLSALIAFGALCERILRGGLTGHRNHQKQHAAAKERFRILVAHQCRASSKTAVLVDMLLRKALMQVRAWGLPSR
jgi:hypothetical protein